MNERIEHYMYHTKFIAIMLENWTIDELRYMHITVENEE